jgi:phospholipid/cholesterol/gamma-HCH transport system permease protein
MSSLSESPSASSLPPRPVRRSQGALDVPKQWLVDSGLLVKFTGFVLRDTVSGRVLVFSGETIRQAGILIISSTLFIWGLIFITGLQCGIEGAYLLQSQGAPQYAGLFSAWCDLREIAPLAFGYMMAAKVGTGIVAELGSMRISDEIDALEVMGISGITFLCATRLLASWLVLPFIYLGGIVWGFIASYVAVVEQVANVSSGGYSLIFWEFQNPGDLLFSMIKALAMATVIVLVGCYYGYTASGGPVGVGTATAKSMVVNIVSVHVIGMLGTQLFWGANPRAPIGG